MARLNHTIALLNTNQQSIYAKAFSTEHS